MIPDVDIFEFIPEMTTIDKTNQCVINYKESQDEVVYTYSLPYITWFYITIIRSHYLNNITMFFYEIQVYFQLFRQASRGFDKGLPNDICNYMCK